MLQNNKKIFRYLLILVIPSLLFMYTLCISNRIILSIEMFCLSIYFIFIIYFTKDLFNPSIFFFVNIFLGIMDIYFVAIKFRTVAFYHSIEIYEKSLFLILIWLLTFSCGYKILNRKFLINEKKKIDEYKNHKFNYSLIYISLLFLTFLLVKVILTIKKSGTISMDLSFFDGQGFMVAMFPLCGFIPICFLEEKKKKCAILSTIVIFLTISLSGRRYVAIITTVFPLLVYYHYKIKKIEVKNLILLAIPIIIFVIIVGHIRLQNSHQVYSENPLLNTMITLGKYIQYGQNLPDLVYTIDSKKIEYQGFTYIFRGVIGLIPRSIWVNKPEVDYSNITSQLVYGIDKGYGEPVGQFGWAYLCFGYFGVIFSGFLTGFIAKLFYKWMREKNNAYSIAVYSLLIMQVINIFTPDSQMKIILFILFILFVSFFNSIRRDAYEKYY